MQSKSLIGRVTPDSLPIFVKQGKKEISYYARYNSEWLTMLAIFLAIFGIIGGAFFFNNMENNHIAYEQSLKYHYAVGSNQKCNPRSSGIAIDSDSWLDCKIVGVSKNNIYYDVSVYNPSSHKQETDNVQIQYVSNK